MASQGPNSPTTGASSGSPAWSPTNDAGASDDARVTSSVPLSSTSGTFTVTGFGFNAMGDTATVDGILLEIERQGQSGLIRDQSIRLVLSGSPVGDDKATATLWPAPGSEAYASYGGATDDWNAGLTGADLKDPTFGASIQAYNTSAATARTAAVDHARITVYYTEGGGAQTIGMNAISSTATLYQPAVAPGAVTVETNQIGSTVALYEPTVGDGSTTTVYEPQAGSDDGRWSWEGGAFANNGTDLFFGDRFGDGEEDNAFIRFPTAVITTGDTVEAGTKLTLTASASTSDTANVRIYGVTGGSPVAPTDVTEAHNLPLTTAFVAWSPSAWTSGNTYDSPDIDTILQELADAGQAEDGVMLVILDQFTSLDWRVFAAYEHASLDPAKLTVVTTAGIPTIIAPHISSTAILNTPALVYDQPVATNAISGTAAVNQPAVTPGAVAVATNAISSTASLHQPSVAPGSVTVAVDELGGTITLYEPAVATDALVVGVDQIGSSAALYELSVTPGAVSIAMNQIASTLALYQPTITTLTTISANLITNTVTLYQPAVTVGTAYISAQAIASALAVYTPLVAGGEPQTTYQVYVEGRVLEINVSGAVLTVSVAGATSDISVRGSIT